jgi:hypothetical protein
MSTVAYAQLTNRREQSPAGTSSTTSSPGLKTYVDAFAALVPTEVLTLHALIIAATTTTSTPAAGGAQAVAATTVTTILADGADALRMAFWILLVLSLLLYVVPRYYGGKWDRYDIVRAAIAPLAFVGWTMLQRATAFDAAFPFVGPIDRTVYALILGAVLGAVTAGLAAKADAKTV